MFTPFHKPPYTYPYGKSVDKTTTIAISLKQHRAASRGTIGGYMAFQAA
jgi:hypothetical protein